MYIALDIDNGYAEIEVYNTNLPLDLLERVEQMVILDTYHTGQLPAIELFLELVEGLGGSIEFVGLLQDVDCIVEKSYIACYKEEY